MKLRKRLLMSRSTAEGQTTSRHSRVVDGIVIVAIALGVVVNAAVLIDHRNNRWVPEPAPASNSVLADATDQQVGPDPTSPPVTVAGLVEERPAWAKELADQVSVLAALIAQQQEPTTTLAPRPTTRRSPTTTLPTAVVQLGPATALDRPDPTVPSSIGDAISDTIPSDPITTTSTAPSPDPTYRAAS